MVRNKRACEVESKEGIQRANKTRVLKGRLGNIYFRIKTVFFMLKFYNLLLYIIL